MLTDEEVNKLCLQNFQRKTYEELIRFIAQATTEDESAIDNHISRLCVYPLTRLVGMTKMDLARQCALRLLGQVAYLN